MHAGDRDIDVAVAELAATLPAPLQPLASVAFDYRWCWAVDGPDTFAAIDPGHGAHCGANPRWLLNDALPPTIPLAGHRVAGCDVWVNLPRPPNEASGTSGMKSVLGGGLLLSVLDGWWAEAYDGTNGFAINGDVDPDHSAQDWHDAHALFDLHEQVVAPMFHGRDADGVPQRWVAMMRRSLMTHGPRFSATRMVREYAERIYRRIYRRG